MSAAGDAWLAECWPVCREYKRGEAIREWASTAAREGFAACRTCGVVFRQPRGLEIPWEFCTDCSREVAS